MVYTVDDEAKDIIIQIDAKLNIMEVKGDSVEHLFFARKLLKQLFDSFKEVKQEEEKREEG